MLEGGGEFVEGERYLIRDRLGNSQKMVSTKGKLMPMPDPDRTSKPTSNIQPRPINVPSLASVSTYPCQNTSVLNNPLISKIDKNHVVLEGGEQFKECKAYMIRDQLGNSQKMVWAKGGFMPMPESDRTRRPSLNIKQNPVLVPSISTNPCQNTSVLNNPLISKIDKNHVVLEGGGEFEEGMLYLIRDRLGNSQKMVWTKNGFMPMRESDRTKRPSLNIKQPVLVPSISTNLCQNTSVFINNPLISKIDKNHVVLEGGGEFEVDQAYMIRDRLGNSKIMVRTKDGFMPLHESDRTSKSTLNIKQKPVKGPSTEPVKTSFGLTQNLRKRKSSAPVSSDDSDKFLTKNVDFTPDQKHKPSTITATLASPVPESDAGSISCPICLDFAATIKAGGKKIMTTTCGHVFCQPCLEDAVKNFRECPMCRKNIDSTKMFVIHI